MQLPEAQDGDLATLPALAGDRQGDQAALESRPKPRDKADADLVFLTPAGQRWVWTRGNPADIDVTDIEKLAHVSRADRVTVAMGQLLGKLGLARRGHTFYALRHTFETIGGESRDQVAVDAIMGHSREDMASVYRERIGDDRLRAVVEHVRHWLLEKPLKRKDPRGKRGYSVSS